MQSHSPRRPQSSGRREASRDAAADYIAQMTAELAEIAAAARLDLLSYFLKMAQMEAEGVLREEEQGR